MEGAYNVRLSLLTVNAGLALGIALTACSGSNGISSSLPSGGQAFAAARSGHQGEVTRPMPGVTLLPDLTCNYSEYAFCIQVTPRNPGPYVETSAGSGYELYNHAWIVRNTTGAIDKHFKTHFSPYPGNPTYQYINFTGKIPRKDQSVKFTDYYCIGFSPSACAGNTYTFKIGIALTTS